MQLHVLHKYVKACLNKRAKEMRGCVMKRKILSLMLSATLVLGAQTPVIVAAEKYADGEAHTIGVVVYDPDAPRWKCLRIIIVIISKPDFR